MQRKESKGTVTASQPMRQPPIQETLVTREYMPAKFTHIAAKFQQKAREGTQAW